METGEAEGWSRTIDVSIKVSAHIEFLVILREKVKLVCLMLDLTEEPSVSTTTA